MEIRSFDRSDQIDQLGIALAKAQAEIEGAKKEGVNPHFRSKYADLGSVWEACRDALTKHGLSVVQIPGYDGNLVSVVTVLIHASGQYISGQLCMPLQKAGPQAVGSSITYARRYALMAFVGIAPEDDDGNAAQKHYNEQPRQTTAPAKQYKPPLNPAVADDIYTGTDPQKTWLSAQFKGLGLPKERWKDASDWVKSEKIKLADVVDRVKAQMQAEGFGVD